MKVGGHLEMVKLLLEHKAPVDVKEESLGGTPLGWALYAWGEAAREGGAYYEVVALLVAAGAKVDHPEWLADPDRGMPLVEMARADPRMLAALRGELPR